MTRLDRKSAAPPGPKTRPGGPVARRDSDFLLTTGALLVALVLLVVAGCTGATEKPKPTVAEKIKETSLATKDEIRIGVYKDAPLMGYVENGVRSGFDIDLARSVAKFLGFEPSQIKWVELTTAERDTFLQAGQVDLVIASYSMTADRLTKVRFAGPYLVTTQAVLIHKRLEGQIREIPHLRGHRVCVTGASTSKEQLEREKVEVETLTNRQDCVQGILDGRYQAMSSDRTILAGFVHQHPRELAIVPMPFGGNERLGIGIPKNDEALEQLVTYYLHKSYRAEQAGEATDWQIAYRENLWPYLGAIQQPPPDGRPIELFDQDVRNRR
ncbi:transporter substrate-binding domain-containing protein [Micromonospora sp. NPDC049559]|uniref:transporter substrate-binding domain-containing protein n=1 Tax=Micromonospora sp. NPDC049559 TaxID=3155923 RepID=UPI00342604CF